MISKIFKKAESLQDRSDLFKSSMSKILQKVKKEEKRFYDLKIADFTIEEWRNIKEVLTFFRSQGVNCSSFVDSFSLGFEERDCNYRQNRR